MNIDVLPPFHIQWIPLPLFLIYRVFLAVYLLVWLALHIYARHEGSGVRWLIFISNLGYALLAISMTSVAILCVTYGIVYYTKRSILVKYLPKKDFPLARVYKQDNIPWFVKIVWILYFVANSSALLIFFGYWVFIYQPCSGDDSSKEAAGGAASSSGSGDAGMGDLALNGSGDASGEEACSNLDVYAVQIHLINVIIILLDLFLSRIPYQFLHLLYSTLFALVFIIFTLIYFGARGTNPAGDPYIYSTLNYGEETGTSIFYAIVIILSCIAFHIFYFLLAWLRDAIYKRIGCCFRDIQRHPFRESSDEVDRNGIGDDGAEMTKV